MSSESGASSGVEGLDLARVGFVAVAAAAVWFHLWEPFARISVIGLAATLVGGYPIFKEAAENVVERKMTMELSMTIALVAALAIGEFFTALIITLFVLAAEILEGMTVRRGRRAIGNLLDFLPRTATVRRGPEIRQVSADEIGIGDLVLVNPGGRIPIDGTVAGGHSFVDQAPITGESMPVEKTAGAWVYAGTINQSGALEIGAERLGRDTSFGKIIEAVEQAERSRAPIQKLADRLAGYLVYFALGAAVLTFLITRDVRSTISVVIVAGACGIAAGTPLAILGGIGRAARQGAIIKGGRYLETLARADTVIFDKTGTLTLGIPEVQDLVLAVGVSAPALLAAAAAAERRSEHPLAKAILTLAESHAIPVIEPQDFAYTPGRGITARVDGDEIVVGNRALLRERQVTTPDDAGEDGSGWGAVLVARSGRYLGAIRVADTIRPEAKAAVAGLKAIGIRTMLLTGDAKNVAEAVAAAVGVDELAAELLPEAKQERVKSLVDRGRVVAMVGDGINDAPALMQASVGVAMGSGTDVARESASVVLLGNDLLKFVETVRLARRTRRTILQNFVGTIAIDGVGVGLAAMGFLIPPLAAFIHVASELVFILNSARLLPSAAAD
ncbi:MAG TPA: cation-translocating P-type ATPase [Gemmatimonadales bacterium]|nr:cation-translocating P-type ATPase [Gemmatimonadales bacterium]